jgi:uncharacterized lipoprotein YddW (UPF0748 family)
MKRTILISLMTLAFFTAFAQNPKREVRAVWLTTHLGLDWPTMADDVATKKTKLTVILDNLKTLNVNTIYFQVRGVADAFYLSQIVPWSNRLTGINSYGINPEWDPLEFAIEECHKRGMEIHAWLNPYRAATDEPLIENYSATHKAKTNPEWLLEQATTNSNNGYVTRLKYFNPALAAVRDHIDNVVKELVTNYDLDGVHFDDYFYYSGLASQDQTHFNADKRGFTDINEWRRDNVTLLIRRLNNSIKTLKPWVKFGISPSGIYRNFTVNSVTPNVTTTGSQHYATQYADTKKWMEEGSIDYLVPQVYWAFSQTTANAKFNYVVDNWNSMNFERHLYIGLSTYRTKDGTSSAYTENEIKNQINYLRNTPTNVLGTAHFRAAHTVTTLTATEATMEYVRDNQYNTPALIPAMNWIDNVAPDAPTALTSTLVSGETKLDWTAPTVTADELQKVVRYAVYRSTSPTIDFNLASNLIAVIPSSATTYTDNQVTPGGGTAYYYAVRSLDRMSNESISSNTIADPITLPVTLTNFFAKKDGNRVKIEWTTTSELNNDYFLLEKAGNGGNFAQLDKQEPKIANEKGTRSYTSFDTNPNNGVNYYRLTQVDKNGTSAKPEVTVLNFNELIVVNAVAFPNPTKGDIKFKLENYDGKSITARVTNLLGQIVHQEKFEISIGENEFKLNLKSNLANGHYVLSLYDTNYNKNIKLIVN